MGVGGEGRGSSQLATQEVVKLAHRFYSLRFVAMEIFLSDKTVIMVNCKSSAACRRLHDAIARRARPPMLRLQPADPRAVLAGEARGGIGLTEAWVQREITNFEYLMALNTAAGRTYNDLAQYPIFPWVLSDYGSERLDLSNPRSFRDLRYPMGIQNPRMRSQLQQRYRELETMAQEMAAMNDDFDDFGGEDFDGGGGGGGGGRGAVAAVQQYSDPLSAPFHYGSCYSNPGSVLWYLVRLEPFASLHINLQDGHFDKPDRLFDSMPRLTTAAPPTPPMSRSSSPSSSTTQSSWRTSAASTWA